MGTSKVESVRSHSAMGDDSTALQPILRYEELSSDFPEIRLLTLQNSVDEYSLIECTLERSSLELGKLSGYTALSYVWGDAAVTEDILVSGCVFPATTNLVSALRHIRKLNGEIVLWVDAICIDQSNLAERGKQVQLMQSIYSNAEKVIAWLGPDNDGGSEALRMLGKMMAVEAQDFKDFLWLKSIPDLYKFDGDNNSHVLERWMGISQLLERPYWSRVWILQEAVLARELLLMCGTECAYFSGTTNLSIILLETRLLSDFQVDWLSPDIIHLILSIDWTHWLRIASFRATVQETSISSEASSSTLFDLDVHLLVTTMRLRATDPRDKIYGLLGITTSMFVPNYTKNAREVFTDITKILLSSECKEVLTYATTWIRSGVLQDLPSWIPDWQMMSTSGHGGNSSIVYDKYDAGRSIWGVGVFSVQGNVLSCSGHLFDCVTRTESEEPDPIGDLAFIHNIGAFVDQSSEYPTGVTKLQALIRTFHAGLDSGYSRLEITSRWWPSAAAHFIFHLVDECKKAAPHLTVRESYNLVKSSMGFKLEGEEAETALLELCFRGSGHLVNASPLQNPMFEGYDFPIMAHLPIFRVHRQKLRLFCTEKGYVGAHVQGMAVGDRVAIIRGCKVPMILRKQNSHFVIIGPCYVEGIMDGEAIEDLWYDDFTDIEIH